MKLFFPISASNECIAYANINIHSLIKNFVKCKPLFELKYMTCVQ